MTIPTEPIGSIPRPPSLIEAVASRHGDALDPALEPLFDAAVRNTIARFEATGSPVVSDGEQRKYHNFWDYCVRRCLDKGAHAVQVDFTEGRLAIKPGQRIFVGVIDPLDPRVESDEEVRDRTLEAAEFLPVAQLGTADDCGFSPFSDDLSTSRDTAFAKIAARVRGTRLAAAALGAS